MDVYDQVYLDYLPIEYKETIMAKTRHREFDDDFDLVYVKNKKKRMQDLIPEEEDDWDEDRMDIIGKNGPTGDHYE